MNKEEAFLKACLEDFIHVPMWVDYLLEQGEEGRAKKLRARWKNWGTWRAKAHAVINNSEYAYLQLADSLFGWGLADSPQHALDRFVADYEVGEDESFKRYLERFLRGSKPSRSKND